MDIRLLALFRHEAEAVNRQWIYRMISSISICLADGAEFQKFIRELELTTTRQENADAVWESIYRMGRG